MTEWEGSFALDGLPLRLRVDAHVERLAPFLHALPEAPRVDVPAIDVQLAWSADDRGPAPSVPAFFQGVVRVGVIEDGWVLRGGGGWLTVRRGEATTRIEGACGSEAASIAIFTRRTLFMALALALREHARFHLHAAMVADGTDAWLLVGSSGRGKSTTALALAQTGMQALADDFVVVTSDGSVCPVPRAFHVSSRTHRAFLSERAGEALPDPDRRAVAVAPREARRRTISALILLEGIEARTRVEPVTTSFVLGRLLEESAIAVVEGATRVDEQLEALRRLASAPALCVAVGPEVLTDPRSFCVAVRERLSR